MNNIHKNFRLPLLTEEDLRNATKELNVQKDSIFISLRILLRTLPNYFEYAYFGCKAEDSIHEVKKRLKRSTFSNAVNELGIQLPEFTTKQMKVIAIKNHLIRSDKAYREKLLAEQQRFMSRQIDDMERFRLEREERHYIYSTFIRNRGIENTEENYKYFIKYGRDFFSNDEIGDIYDEPDINLDEFTDNHSCLSCGSNQGCFCPGGN